MVQAFTPTQICLVAVAVAEVYVWALLLRLVDISCPELGLASSTHLASKIVDEILRFQDYLSLLSLRQVADPADALTVLYMCREIQEALVVELRHKRVRGNQVQET